jgi:hypothetical protein
MRQLINRYRRPRIVGASLTSASQGPGESATAVGGRRCAAAVRGSRMAFGACLLAVLLATTSLTAAAAWGATDGVPGTGDKSFNPAADSEGNHCLSPEGVDVNELLGVSEHLVVGGNGCGPVRTGEFYVPLGGSCWNTNTSWEVMPDDYTPAAATPVEDFLSKLLSITYVVEPGTPSARSYRFRAQDVVAVGNVRDVLPISGPDQPSVCFLAKLPPLPAGVHTYDAFVEMSARSCDGLGVSESINCLPAGTTRLGSCRFTVATPAAKPGD